MGDTPIRLILPELWLAVAGMVILVAGLRLGKARERTLSNLAIGSLVVALGLVLELGWRTTAEVGFSGSIALDHFATFFKALFLVSSILSLVMARRYVERSPYGGGELSALIVFATIGMMFLAAGKDLITLYIGLELMALSTYVLAGYFKGEVKSNEAGLKYFVLGGLSSGILLYGLSLLYGATGSTNLAVIAEKLGPGPGRLALLGMVFVAAGLFFKVAAAPFHVWVPDVYEGAPTPITAFMSVGPKAAAYAFFARIFYDGLHASHDRWVTMVAVVAAVTMVWGNVAALLQDNVKRLLAYSSIAHAGYALLGVVALDSQFGLPGLLYYLVAYTFMNLGAFGFVILLETKGYAGEQVSDYDGFARKHPWLAATMLLFLLSLAGIPPTAGFFGKYLLFAAAVRSGYVWLGVIAVVASAISLFYYMRIGAAMYLKDKEWDQPLLGSPGLTFTLGICAVMTLVLGVVPQPFLELVRACIPAIH